MTKVLKLIEDVRLAAEDEMSGELAGHFHLLQAVRKLYNAVEQPTEALRRILFQPIQNSTLRIAVEMGLAECLVNDSPLSCAKLAEKTGTNENLIVRVMRVLAAMNLCEELCAGVYKSTPLTHALACPAFSGGTKFTFDTLVPTSAKLLMYLKEHGFKSPENKSPFAYTFNLGLWPYLKENPLLQQGMMDFMAGRQIGVRWVDIYPAATCLSAVEDKGDGVLLIDIGGNQGHDLKLFKETYPQLTGRLILMDLLAVVECLPRNMDGIEVLEYDMFTPQPIQGAQVYFYRSMLHCWPDEACKNLLRIVAKAMKPGYSRLLINEHILPDTGVELHRALLDMMMMSQCAGMERTERQWRALLESVGLSILKIWTIDGVDPIIEAMVKE